MELENKFFADMLCKPLDIQINGDVTHFKVDPFHGFLFWIENGSKLVQLELGCNNNHQNKKVLVSNGHRLGDFTILFQEFKLQVADLTENALLELDIVSQRSRLSTNIM